MSGPHGTLSIAPETLASMQQSPSDDEAAPVPGEIILVDAHGERFHVTGVRRHTDDPADVRFSVEPSSETVPLTAVRDDMRALMEAPLDALFPPPDLDGIFDGLTSSPEARRDFSKSLREVVLNRDPDTDPD